MMIEQAIAAVSVLIQAGIFMRLGAVNEIIKRHEKILDKHEKMYGEIKSCNT